MRQWRFLEDFRISPSIKKGDFVSGSSTAVRGGELGYQWSGIPVPPR
jgi:hypothetical protein